MTGTMQKKGIKGGIGCGVGIGYGFGAGLMLKPGVAEESMQSLSKAQGMLLQTVGERFNMPGLAKTMEEAGIPGASEALKAAGPQYGEGTGVDRARVGAGGEADAPSTPPSTAAPSVLQERGARVEGSRPSAVSRPGEMEEILRSSNEALRMVLRQQEKIDDLQQKMLAAEAKASREIEELRASLCKVDKKAPMCKRKPSGDDGGRGNSSTD
eukprot:CAMPEP_0118959888 /NCGR_PEP_ID=MMETSP1169-20130426/63359_1 /TAXON_ID=36882 /ORGANISM="Pyramimonas obovata, Strain CCMP722" /LENGTH=211 /DNA_ID=CAMNT_0006908029 /DNA_START=1334 /DNA_END=1969 /DNA_ORIENTATION=-